VAATAGAGVEAEAGAGAESDQTLAETWLAGNDARKNLALTVANLGDARRGLFVALDRKKANCVGCHLVQGAGGTVGPPLISKLPKSNRSMKLPILIYINEFESLFVMYRSVSVEFGSKMDTILLITLLNSLLYNVEIKRYL
jgi:hypothetical protein